eukprot:9136-Heterococcus_DN1.PRE.5
MTCARVQISLFSCSCISSLFACINNSDEWYKRTQITALVELGVSANTVVNAVLVLTVNHSERTACAQSLLTHSAQSWRPRITTREPVRAVLMQRLLSGQCLCCYNCSALSMQAV